MNEGFACEAVAQSHCAVCPKSFIPKQKDQRCCGTVCANKLAHLTRSSNAAERNRRVCKACGNTFQRRNPSGSARKGLSKEGQFCSHNCRADANRLYPDKRAAKAAFRARRKVRLGLPTAPQSRQCCCGEWFLPSNTSHVYCKVSCRPASVALEYKSCLSHSPTTCKKCSRSFIPIEAGRRKFCSPKCTKEFHRKASGGTHRKRARYHGVTYEYINTLTVLERDGWRCQVCFRKTPKRLRGSIDECAPELDHRIPMALGGGHIWSNVQCACRRCNLAKSGDKIAGQTNFMDVLVPPRRHRTLKVETQIG